ncbi:alpha/beta fold hydrolase [Streptomyces boninensis]|uniref:alpha/beta fold hydrolase n=1 Tax=Streptomyces boninensis TaxID=2039455 RepID=UPI003B21E275
MTEFLKAAGGELAYEVTGEGPLVVLAHGMGDGRKAYRHLLPHLTGYRVATLDIRGHGESSTGWPSYTRTDVATDILALIRHLDSGPAVVVGHSFAGGAATIAGAEAPELITAVVEIGPFTKDQKIDVGGLLRNAHHRRGIVRLMGAALFKSPRLWRRYLDVSYAGARPTDYKAYVEALDADLRRAGRFDVVSKMGMSKPSDAGAQLPNLHRPALILMGTRDPDWADPRAEAESIAAQLSDATVVMIEGAGHYPHAQFPEEVAAALLPFLKAHTGA